MDRRVAIQIHADEPIVGSFNVGAAPAPKGVPHAQSRAHVIRLVWVRKYASIVRDESTRHSPHTAAHYSLDRRNVR